MTNCNFTGKSPPKIHSIKFCSKVGFHFKMSNYENYTQSSSSTQQKSSPNNILQEAFVNAFAETQYGIRADLFPDGPTRSQSIDIQQLIPTLDQHQSAGLLMPPQILPHDFKIPPQIDCLSSNQTEKSIADLKALLASWGMLQLYEWFAGKLNTLYAAPYLILLKLISACILQL